MKKILQSMSLLWIQNFSITLSRVSVISHFHKTVHNVPSCMKKMLYMTWHWIGRKYLMLFLLCIFCGDKNTGSRKENIFYYCYYTDILSPKFLKYVPQLQVLFFCFFGGVTSGIPCWQNLQLLSTSSCWLIRGWGVEMKGELIAV